MSDLRPPAAAPETEKTSAPAPAATATESFIIATPETDESIRPFEVHFPDEALADLKRRVLATRWPDKETVDDDTQGVQLGFMQKLAAYWASDYDWRRCEAKLNAVPNYMTMIDGLDIHFVHVRSKHENALPIVITHGWPGSVVEQLKLVGPLTDPTAYGGTAEDAFHVVIPSIAGFGFAGRPTEPGWDAPRMARAWTTLMKRLGYDRFVAQGGDWGALITELLGVQAPPELIAIHTNMPSAVPPEVYAAIPTHVPPPGLTPEELHAFERLDFFFAKDLSYGLQMATRPQTLYGIVDSPIGLAAWFCDHDIKSYELKARVFDGVPEGMTRDDILDNITLAWLTNTAISSARLYWENKLAFFAPLGVKVPIAVSVFPDELYPCPRSWAERTYPQLIHYNQLPKGGHFAAWEQPEYLSQEIRTAFRAVR